MVCVQNNTCKLHVQCTHPLSVSVSFNPHPPLSLSLSLSPSRSCQVEVLFEPLNTMWFVLVLENKVSTRWTVRLQRWVELQVV